MGVSVTLSTPPPGPRGRWGAAEAAPQSPSCLADALPSCTASAYLPTHTSLGFRKPSSKTTLMLSLVIASGVSSTDGTSRAVSFVLPLTRPASGCLPVASAMASLEAASASFLTAL